MNLRTAFAFLAAGTLGAALGTRLGRRPWTFENRVVLITGGSRGLGLALARGLAAEGAYLALAARSREDLWHAAQGLKSYNVPVLTIPTDVRYEEDVAAAIDITVQQYGRIDVLINNAGIIQVGPAENMGSTDYEDALATHFWGPLYAMREVIPYMKRQGGGRIVNIASIGGKIAVPHLAPYSASKFALVGLSDAFRNEYAKDNIAITTVCPWLMRTGSYRNVTVKGRHRLELAWFALADSLPLLTMSDHSAVEQILESCRRGVPRLILSPWGKAAHAVDANLPQVSAATLSLANRFLPRASTRGTQVRRGFESFSHLAPSLFTSLSDDAAQRNNQLKVSKRRSR